ncbi:putative ribosomal protein 50S-L18Ae/60S-L20/60S-L18A [Rosa chinensis]|uniref:Putative ribosomal protein 50S-L18Ae/60S-L20/60S-L18A n=1 Tax=Rosa chinensis TaxID=74649 RepID=A0A2P6QM23_ROSCH|nr:putative ribosomal protein 50S-L18Ae/60S-L20/60S-L18A [Rosa chinensis]
MYKEYRDTTLNGDVDQMCTEMASRHRVRFPCIQIIETATIPAKLCKRESTKQFHNSKIKFPLNSNDAFMSDYVRILILGMHWIRNRTTLPVKKCV